MSVASSDSILPGVLIVIVLLPVLYGIGRAGKALGDVWSAYLLAPLAPDAGLVTLIDGAPASLSWLGGVRGQRVSPLGVDRFGQTGNLAELYAAYRLDGAAITEAVAEVLLARARTTA